jgi:hypothetical protein
VVGWSNLDFAQKCIIFVLQKGRTTRFSSFFALKMAKTTFDVVKTSSKVVKNYYCPLNITMLSQLSQKE